MKQVNSKKSVSTRRIPHHPLIVRFLAQAGTFRSDGVAVVSQVLCTSATLNKRTLFNCLNSVITIITFPCTVKGNSAGVGHIIEIVPQSCTFLRPCPDTLPFLPEKNCRTDVSRQSGSSPAQRSQMTFPHRSQMTSRMRNF